MPIAAAIPYVVAAASTYSAVKGASAASKAAGQAGQAANASQVDIDQLDQKTRAIAKQNALDAAALEKQLTPEVPQLRTASNLGVLSSLGMDPSVSKAKAALEAQSGVPLDTPLLKDAIAKARSDLALGGKLSVDQQNAATRTGAAQAGTAGGGNNLGLGRDLAARDLGLSSMQVEQQRLQNASTLGGQEMNLATNNATNLLNTLNTLQGVDSTQFGKYLSAAQYGQSIQQPTVGLDPTAIANLTVANANNKSAILSNQANVSGASGNAWLNLAGKGAGALLSYYGGKG